MRGGKREKILSGKLLLFFKNTMPIIINKFESLQNTNTKRNEQLHSQGTLENCYKYYGERLSQPVKTRMTQNNM